MAGDYEFDIDMDGGKIYKYIVTRSQTAQGPIK